MGFQQWPRPCVNKVTISPYRASNNLPCLLEQCETAGYCTTACKKQSPEQTSMSPFKYPTFSLFGSCITKHLYMFRLITKIEVE